MKENKIEKLILDLSNRWECTPQEAVDRLNSMNESEINKLIKDMAKKFQWGGLVKPPIQPRFVAPAHLNPARSDVRMQQSAPSVSSSGVLTADMMEKERKNEAQKLMESASDLRSKQYADFLKQHEINRSTHSNQNMNRIMKNGGFIDCLRKGGSISKCKCGCGKIAKAQEGLPDLSFNKWKVWGNTPTQPNIDYYYGSKRSVGNVSDFVPSKIGTRILDLKYRSEGETGTGETPFEYLNGWERFFNILSNENKVKTNDPGLIRKGTPEWETQKKSCGGPLPKKSKLKK